jgi:cysteinyl-tRNA synthetase
LLDRLTHNAHILNINGEKMSKSEGNFFTAREVLAEYSAEAIRFFFLSKHYRSPIDFNREIIQESEKAMQNFYETFQAVDFMSFVDDQLPQNPELQEWENKFCAAMNDDFNTAKAISILFDLNKTIRSQGISTDNQKAYALLLYKLGTVLGFFQNMASHLTKPMDGKAEALIELLIQYRQNAKADKNWALSDKIRNDLKDLGIELMDTKTGTEWKSK